MIPKTIHYCWFGGKPLPKLAKTCIRSWKRHARGYKIMLWNESNYDLASAPLYVRQAYVEKKWAFVTDYVRLQVVYEHGGIYLDTDVELKKPLDPLLQHGAYFGFEDGVYVNTGLGFGAEKGAPILKELMDDYAEIPFLQPDGSIDLTACPVRNTRVFLRHGLRQDDSPQLLDGTIAILPTVFLCPVDYHLRWREGHKAAYSVHWFSASWYPEQARKNLQSWRAAERRDYLVHTPNRLLIKLLGAHRYQKLKNFLKGR